MISVCIATFNGAKYINQQIDSIISQIGKEDEIIISDDGSTDDTVNKIKAYNDERIKIYNHDKKAQKFTFGYAAKNFENAMENASGDLIFLSDQDDVWLPGKVSKMVEILKHADIVMSDCSITDENLNILLLSKFEAEGVRVSVLANIYKSKYLGCCMAFQHKILKDILPIPSNVPHDLWIGIVAGIKGKFELLHTPMMLYRRHDNNLSANRAFIHAKQEQLPKSKNSIFFMLSYRFYVAIAYFLRRIQISQKK